MRSGRIATIVAPPDGQLTSFPGDADLFRSQQISTEPQETTSHAPSERRILSLDGIRGLAILGVFFFHFGGGNQHGGLLVNLWAFAVNAGWMGVDLFFVLSGFLITGILFDTAHKQAKVKTFYARRALRIFPLFYGVLFGFLLLTPVMHLHWQAGHLLYFFYLSNMIGVLDPSLPAPGTQVVLNHFWSLAIEEQFYLLWPIVVWFVKDRRKLLWICGGIIVAVVLLRFVLLAHGLHMVSIFPLLPTRADSLLCGGALALLVRGPARLGTVGRVLLPVTGLLTLGIVLEMAWGTRGEDLLAGIGYTVVAVFFTCVVFFAQTGRGPIAALGAHPWLRFLGRYSYGLYIYQGLLLFAFRPLVGILQRTLHSRILGGAVFMIVSLASILAISVASYHLFEEPILKLKSRFV